MKLIVTGGLGFIGSNFIRHILATTEDEVLNFDKMTYAANPANVSDIEGNERYSFVQGDIADRDLVRHVTEEFQPDAIVNMAAETHVDRSILDPEAFVRTDVMGTHVLLDAVREFDIGRYVQVSTDEVYGSIDEGLFTEEHPLEPNSPYSASKSGGDLLVRAYVETYGIPALITRGSNNYGPHQYPEKLIPLFVTNLIEGKKVPVYGDGQQVRDWIHVLDHCRGVDAVLRKGKEGEVYNIGGRNERTNLEITKMILDGLGQNEDMIDYVEDRAGHDRRYALDISKAERELDWSPEVSFEEGMNQTIKWYKENEEWWRPLKSGEYLEYYKRQYNDR